MNKRLFISHASEDKQPFVRELAKGLKFRGIDVWYDEYEIKPGMSIRESVDFGLASCDIGLIILSPNYFRKKWTIWELNGLVQKMLNETAKLVPIRYELSQENLLQISPSLADILSLNADEGVEILSQKLYELLYPSEPVLVETRKTLNSYGLLSPDYYDNWWLDRIQFWGQNGVPFIPWSLPNNPSGIATTGKSQSLAWACMRYTWIDAARQKRLNQFSEPHDVLNFVEKLPGVKCIYKYNLDYLGLYAPQLFFFDSPIKREFEQAYYESVTNIKNTSVASDFNCELSNDKKIPTCNRIFALLDKDFGNYRPYELLRHFIEGERFGPQASTLDYWDVLIMLCSEKANIYPSFVRNILMEGFRSKYSALQLKKVFIDKSPMVLASIFSDINKMQQAIDEMITDRQLTVLTSSRELAETICAISFNEELFVDKTFRLTIPTNELCYNYRGITFMKDSGGYA